MCGPSAPYLHHPRTASHLLSHHLPTSHHTSLRRLFPPPPSCSNYHTLLHAPHLPESSRLSTLLLPLVRPLPSTPSAPLIVPSFLLVSPRLRSSGLIASHLRLSSSPPLILSTSHHISLLAHPPLLISSNQHSFFSTSLVHHIISPYYHLIISYYHQSLPSF